MALQIMRREDLSNRVSVNYDYAQIHVRIFPSAHHSLIIAIALTGEPSACSIFRGRH